MLLSRKDEMKLADLGTSKLMENTHASTHAGTPVYMSPIRILIFGKRRFNC